MAAGFAGCLAYTAVFLPLGLFLPKRGLIVGFLYVLFWEGTLSTLSTGLATLSVRRYVQGVLEAGLGQSPLASLLSISGFRYRQPAGRAGALARREPGDDLAPHPHSIAVVGQVESPQGHVL